MESLQGWWRLSPVAGTAAWVHQDFLKEVSADVPASMMVPALQWPSERIVKSISRKIIIQLITLQGKLQVLPQAPEADVHYEIVIDDKTAFYLMDIPQISSFANTSVNVEGTVVPDPHKKFKCPLLHITQIALVL